MTASRRPCPLASADPCPAVRRPRPHGTVLPVLSLQRLTVLFTDEHIWYVEFPPDKRKPNDLYQGTLGAGHRLSYTQDLAEHLRTLRVPGPEALSP